MYKLFLLSMATQFSVGCFSPYMQLVFLNKGYSHSMTGTLIALCCTATIIGPMVISSLSDKVGRTKPFLSFCAIVSALLAVPFLTSSSFAVVALCAFFMNFFFWCFNPMVDGFITKKLEGNTSGYGIIRAIGTMTYVTAMLTFGITGFPHEDDNSSILKIVLVGLSLFFLITLLLDDKKVVKEEKTEGKEEAFSFHIFPKRYWVFLGICALSRLGQGVIEKLLSAYITDELGFGSHFTLFLALGATCEFLCMILFGKLLRNKKISPWALLTITSLAVATRLMLYTIPCLPVFLLAQCLHGLTFGAFMVTVTDYVGKNIAPEHTVLAMSLYWAIGNNLPELISSLTGGFVIEHFGYRNLFRSYALFPLLAFVLCFACKKIINSQD